MPERPTFAPQEVKTAAPAIKHCQVRVRQGAGEIVVPRWLRHNLWQKPVAIMLGTVEGCNDRLWRV